MLQSDVVEEFYLGNAEAAEEDVRSLLEKDVVFCKNISFDGVGCIREEKILGVLKKEILKVPFYLENRLGKFLWSLSSGQLRLIVTEEFKIPISCSHKNYLIALIRRKIFKEENGEYISTLPEETRAVFDFVVKCDGKADMRVILKNFPEKTQLLTKILRRTPLLFFKENTVSQKRKVIIPDEIFKKTKWNWFTYNKDICDTVSNSEEVNNLSSPVKDALLWDITSVLSFLNGTEVKTLKGNRLGRRVCEELKALIIQSKKDEYVDFILKLCLHKNLIYHLDSLVKVDIKPCIEQLKEIEPIRNDFFVFWKERNPLSTYFVEIIDLALHNSLFSSTEVETFLSKLDEYKDSKSFNDMIEELVWIGLLREVGTGLFRVSKLGGSIFSLDLKKSIGINFYIKAEENTENPVVGKKYEEEKFVVQPNGEVMFPHHSSLDKVLYLSHFARRVPCQMLIKFIINKESIVHGLENGLTTEKIFQFLNNNSLKEVPQNLRHLVDDCGKKFGEIEIFSGGDILKVSRPIIIKELILRKEFACFLGEVVGTEIILLKEGADVKKLYKALKKEGYSPKVEKNMMIPKRSKAQSDIENMCVIVKKHMEDLKENLSITDASFIDSIIKEYL